MRRSARGRPHAFERLEPDRTALVVGDMVPFFLDANAYARGIVPNIRALALYCGRPAGWSPGATPS